MSAAHVAQLNIGVMVAATDDPAVAEFMDNLDRINAQADAAPGFVWRLQTDAGNATDIQIFPNPLQLVNMSVWESVATLKAYVYRTEHVDFFRRRAEWFEPDAKQVALWSVEPGTVPDLAEGVRRVDFLERFGPSPYAFGFANPPDPLLFERTVPDDADTAALIGRLDDEPAVHATGPNEHHVAPTADQVTGDAGVMIRARYAGDLVGCGAIRRIAPAVGEIAQLFVDPAVCDRRLGEAIVDQLEWRAAASGLDELRLAAGIGQPAALDLLEISGYERCDPCREPLPSPGTGSCFRKRLRVRAEPSSAG